MSQKGMQFGLLRSLSGCELVCGRGHEGRSRVPRSPAPSGAVEVLREEWAQT